MKQTLCSAFACFCLVVNCADGANKPLNIEYLSSESPRSTTCRTYPMSVTPRTTGSKRKSVPIVDASIVNILSCSGGGSRGVILGRIIEKIEERIKKGVANVFEVIGGTSTGAIAAAAVSMPHRNSLDGPFSGHDIVELYKKEAHVIFSDSKRGLLSTLVNASSYSSDGRKAVFEKYFDGISLSDITSTLLVPYYDLNANQIDFFKSRQAKQEDFANYSLVDVLLGTTAAPTYFKPHQIGSSCNGDEKTACDGGVFANNPAFLSLMEAIRTYPDASSYFLLSICAGKSEPKHYQNVSLFDFIRLIPDILMKAPDDMLNKYAITQCGYNFKNPVYICELNVDIPDELYTIDDSSDEYMRQLIDIVDKDEVLIKKIDRVCDIFLQDHKFIKPKTEHINENNVFILEDISDFDLLLKK